jgi:hypothetical protein
VTCRSSMDHLVPNLEFGLVGTNVYCIDKQHPDLSVLPILHIRRLSSVISAYHTLTVLCDIRIIFFDYSSGPDWHCDDFIGNESFHTAASPSTNSALPHDDSICRIPLIPMLALSFSAVMRQSSNSCKRISARSWIRSQISQENQEKRLLVRQSEL